MERPDILVLGGGGRQGDAWMTGLLAGLEDRHGFAFRNCDYLVGTSAGSVVAAKILSGRGLKRPDPSPPVPDAARAASGERLPAPKWAANSAMAIAAPFAQLGVRLSKAPGEALRSAALRFVPASTRESLNFHHAFPADGAQLDGQLRIVAVERGSGRRTVFGAPGAPQATIAEALAASCALPLVFPPAVIAGREYVDGALWSPTNADAAPASRGAQILVLAPMASLHGPFNAALRAATRAIMLAEASALMARGARVRTVTPNRDSAVSIGRNLMSDAGLAETHAAGYAEGMRL